MRQALARARRSRGELAVLYVDLDHFKEINDALGHKTGDLLLRKAAGRLTRCLREMDTLARMGGDEFVVLLPDIFSAADADSVAQKILAALRRPFDLEGEQRLVTASVGVAFFPKDGSNVEALLEKADAALYRAKELGRDRSERHTPLE